MLPRFAYVRPGSLEEALEHLSHEGARIHAGGTDLLGCLHDGVFAAERVVSLGALGPELGGIREDNGGLTLGALTRISEIAAHPRVRELYPGLAQAAESVASPQLRHQGTLGGNLCQRPRCWYFRGEFPCAKKGGDQCFAVGGENRYHAILEGGPCHIVHPSDTAPMLLALGAELELVSPAESRPAGTHPARTRRLTLEEFYVLPADDLEHENVLEPGEILTRIRIPAPGPGAYSVYRKVRERRAWDFALASIALALVLDGRRVVSGRVALGGVAPIPWRSRAAEAEILGQEIDSRVAARAAAAAVAEARPLEQNGFKVPLVEGLVEAELLRMAGNSS